MSADTEHLSRAAGLAALSVFEALALTLVEHGILAEDDVCAAIDDAIEAHKDAAISTSDTEIHVAAARLAERIKTSIEGDGPGGR
jgi:hypothetical protein